MALSNSQYDAIMREYGKQQMENQHSQEARKKEIYQKVPAVKELEAEIAERSAAEGHLCQKTFRGKSGSNLRTSGKAGRSEGTEGPSYQGSWLFG